MRSRASPFLALAALGVALAFSAPRTARALQGGEDPALLPVLIDKRFAGDGRHQTSLFFSTSMVTKFVEALGAYGAYQYNFSDVIALELSGGFFFPRETNIMREVRANFPTKEPPLTDLFQLQWMGNADLMLVPLYGKMSISSELDGTFDLYFVGGAGAAGTRRKRVFPVAGFDSKVSPVFNFGVGMRWYLTRAFALRFEFRDFFYPDPGSGFPVDPNDPDAIEVSGLTWNLHFQVGFQLAFGGEE